MRRIGAIANPTIERGNSRRISMPLLQECPYVRSEMYRKAGGASLTQAGPGSLYLSLDPGKIGFPCCALTATVTTEPEGRSEPAQLGGVIRLPKIEQLTLTNDKVGASTYAGLLKGSDLDIVEKAGWDA